MTVHPALTVQGWLRSIELLAKYVRPLASITPH